jgi:hypothetical protein
VLALAELLATEQEPAVDLDPVWRLDPRGQQQGRPVDAVEADDLLADQVVHRRPPRLEAGLVAAEADGGGVVDEGVVPDVEDVAGGPRHGHAPVDGGAGDRHVVEALADEAEHLVALRLGLDGVGVTLDPREQPVLVPAEAEEPVVLPEGDDRLEVWIGQLPPTSSASV